MLEPGLSKYLLNSYVISIMEKKRLKLTQLRRLQKREACRHCFFLILKVNSPHPWNSESGRSYRRWNIGKGEAELGTQTETFIYLSPSAPARCLLR